MDVDADVEAGVVPIGVVTAAPLAVGFHSIDSVVELGTVIAMAGGGLIDVSAIGLEAVMAISGIIMVGEKRASDSEQQTAG